MNGFVNLQRFCGIQQIVRQGLIRKYLTITMAEQESKKTKLTKKIGTHNGSFHCDEILACFLLQQLPEYKDAEIVRSRDPAILDTCDVVVDVGGVFDPSTHRYDHHQRSFNETYNSLRPHMKWVTKLSSAGLVYVHFAERIMGQLIGKSADDPMTTRIVHKVYENFIEEVDAIDNGVNQHDGKARYRITTNLSARVAGYNPTWNKKEEMDENVQFKKAMKMVGEEFLDKVNHYADSWWPARELVVEAINNRYKVDPSGEIICLESGGCPWRDHLMTLEEEMKIEPTIKFVLYDDGKGKWRVQAVPIEPFSFENRVPLHEKWRGVRDDKLSEISGIPGCVFVHVSGFVGGNETREGALKMAQETLASRST